MSPHVTYHPIGTDTIRRYVAYLSSPDPAALAGEDYEAAGGHDRFRQAYLDMAGTAANATGAFDTGHGLNLAAAQGFFGGFHYVHDARLSALREHLLPYCQTWQQLIPTWPATESAANELGSKASSGVFIAAHHVEQLMKDAHTDPGLQAALAREFSGEKFQVLWAALNDAHRSGLALLEASGVLEPDAHNIASSKCLTNQTNCDPTGLRLFLAAAPTPSPVVPSRPAPVANYQWKASSAPSLAERMRKRAEDN